LKRRNKARIVALVIVNMLLVARLAFLLLTRETIVRYPALVEQQIIERDDIRANTCTRAILLPASPNAVPVTDADIIPIIDAELAALVSDTILSDYFGRPLTSEIIVHDPLLITAEIFGEERLIYARLWLLPDENGTYEKSVGAVLYIDANAAVPLTLYTDVQVRNPQAEGCFLRPPTNYRRRYETIAPLLFLIALTLILTGVFVDRRDRRERLKLQNEK
jgi:hypothetical protein